MPLFEYECRDCGARFAQLMGMTADSREPRCSKCGSENAEKLISRFSRRRSQDEKLDSLETEALAAGEDPTGMTRVLREMGRQMGDDGDGEDLEELIGEAERDIYDGSEGMTDALANE